jgi:DNA ligase-1
MLLANVVQVSTAIAATRSRKQKVALLAGLLGDLDGGERAIGVAYLAGRPLQQRLNVGYATVHRIEAGPARKPTLTLTTVDDALEQLASISGTGSKSRRDQLLVELLSMATAEEQDYLRRLMVGELRQGALEGIMADALAQALDVGPRAVRRAAMMSGDLVAAATAALEEGPEALDTFQLTLGRPIQPMLAKTAPTPTDALAATGPASVEWKLDGVRIQVHSSEAGVRVWTRNLNEITDPARFQLDWLVGSELGPTILDGEVLQVGRDGQPLPFQDSMSEFGSDEVAPGRLRAFFFDCLLAEGRSLVDEPLSVRRAMLEALLPSESVVPSIATEDPRDAEAFFADAVAGGHEGVVVKALDSPYEAGRRGGAWLKVKPVHTLDLVVLAVEWGSGRRQGWLSNLHLGARDPAGGEFVMLGKTFKGLTDDLLEWQTRRFLELETRRTQRTVYVAPEQVVEVAFDGVQRSTRYPGGVALRFARVKRYRDDKAAAEADTLDTVRSHLRGGPGGRLA